MASQPTYELSARAARSARYKQPNCPSSYEATLTWYKLTTPPKTNKALPATPEAGARKANTAPVTKVTSPRQTEKITIKALASDVPVQANTRTPNVASFAAELGVQPEYILQPDVYRASHTPRETVEKMMQEMKGEIKETFDVFGIDSRERGKHVPGEGYCGCTVNGSGFQAKDGGP